MAQESRDAAAKPYDGTERRGSALALNKEISLGWLISFLVGGVANFAAIIWIAATLVSDVGSLKVLVSEHARLLVEGRSDREKVLIQNLTQDSRLNAHDQALVTHSERITGIERRVYH